MIFNERCTIVANKDGSIKTIFVDQLGFDVASQREFNAGQKTIGDAELSQFLGSVLSTTVAERDVLTVEKTKLTTDLATATKERDALITLPAELKANHAQIILAKNAEIAALKAAFNPPIPVPVAGATKTVSITVDATAWAGILASIYDPALDVPAEKQATDFILHQYAGKFVAWAEKANFVAVDAQAEAAKTQIKEATSARAIAVLSSTQVTIT